MGLRVSTNVASINAQNSLSRSTAAIGKTYAQLSSGSRITKAADDAAGLSISEGLKSQIRSISQADRNANDGLSMIQVAEGGLNEVSSIMTRLRELAIQASSDTVGERERSFVNKEVVQLSAEIQRIAETTRYGQTNLIDGTGDQFDFQIGVYNNDFQDRISYNAGKTSATLSTLGIDGLDFTTKAGAQGALESLDNATSIVNEYRSDLGALQNRLISTSQNLQTQRENLSAANSRIRDTDIAEASADLTKNQILLQASTSTLAQSNVAPRQALTLLN